MFGTETVPDVNRRYLAAKHDGSMSDSWNRHNGVKIFMFCNDLCPYNHSLIWEITIVWDLLNLEKSSGHKNVEITWKTPL